VHVLRGKPSPFPFNEEARLRSSLAVPGLGPKQKCRFDRHLRCDPKDIGLGQRTHPVSLEGDTQWYKSVVGIELIGMSKETTLFAPIRIMIGQTDGRAGF